MQGRKTNVLFIMLSRIFKHGISSILIALALFLVLVIINYIVAVKTTFFDISRNKIFSITEQSKNLLKEVDYPVTIKAFYLSKNFHRINMLLKLYTRENKYLSVELIDPLKNPEFAKKYEIELPRTIIFEAPDKINRLDPPPPGSSNSEIDITLALYRLITNRSNTIYFTDGHGEMSINNTRPNGLTTLRDRLREYNFVVKTINLKTTKEIPEDCSILVIADPAPMNPFTDDEVKIIENYMMYRAGKTVLMISPGLEPNLDRIMALFNLEFGDDFVYETASDRTTERGPTAPLCTPMDRSEITENLPNRNFLFPGVRSINVFGTHENMTLARLLASSENSWAETDIESALDMSGGKRPSRNESEQKGPIVVAVAAEAEIIIPDTTSVRGSNKEIIRSAFFGSAGFVTNAIVAQFPANLEVFLNTFNWITKNEDVIHITPNQVVFTPVEIRQSEKRMISWLSLVIFPFSILLIGVFIWYNKR